MFETICIKPNSFAFPNDIGFIAENLLYYKHVAIIADSETIPKLLQNCDVGLLQELLTEKSLRLCIRENLLAVISHDTPEGLEIKNVDSIFSDSLKVDQVLFDGIFKATGRRGYSRRTAQRLLPLVESIKYENNISDIVCDDLAEQSYMKSTILDTIKFYNPEFELSVSDIQYQWLKKDNGYLLETNLNYRNINKHIPNNPDGNLINPTSFILNIMETRGDMHLASYLNAEIATTQLNTILMKRKFKGIYEKTTKNLDNIFQFNDFVLENGYAIREAINNGDKSFKDFVTLLNKADKFKSWLWKIEEDKSILKEYHKAVLSDTWIDKLPPKILRWCFFTGAGLVLDIALTGGLGTAIGSGLSVGDAFLLDKIVKGWKPNSFVDNNLKKFVIK